jgi:Coenzyme PQQ synthesis protein D (PqqD)
MIEAASVLAHSRDVAWQTIDGETVVLDMRSRELLGLNGVGGRVWNLLDGVRSVAAVSSAVAADFAQPEERVGADVRDFLAALLASGLIVLI